MTPDDKALIAEARDAEDNWRLGPGEMRELCRRLADALERATVPRISLQPKPQPNLKSATLFAAEELHKKGFRLR